MFQSPLWVAKSTYNTYSYPMSVHTAPQPVEIKRLGSRGITISWSDGQQHEISSSVLRNNCPSASSKAARGDTGHDKPLTRKPSALKIVEATEADSLSLEKIWLIGNYAIGMRWKDGHDTGIYPYSLLYALGNPS